jgi:hypothetical protein
MKFQVDPTKRAAVTSAPKQLVDVPLLDRSKVVARRQFLLNDMMMGGMMGGMGFRRGDRRFGPAMAINGQSFDMERIDVETKRGTLELWEIGSQMMAHPFHVHGTQFQILSLNGQAPALHLQGWKDTVLVARNAQILVPLSQLATREHPLIMVKSPNGFPVQSPYVAIANRQAEIMMRIACEFGFTPASRSRIAAPSPAEPTLFDAFFEPEDDVDHSPDGGSMLRGREG